MPFFSVIIATYNNASYLGAALESAKSQTHKDYEIIVIDDGSTDDTPNVLKHWKDQIKIIEQDNRGVAAARNAGCNAARGDYCAFLDSDDLWLPWCLESLAEVIQQADGPAMVGLAFRPFFSESELEDIVCKPLQFDSSKDYLEGAKKHAFYMGTAHTVLRRDTIIDAGGFDPLLPVAEDSDLFLRAGIAKGFCIILQPLVLGYRKHDSSLTRNVGFLYQGGVYLINQEKLGRYPGGKPRRSERRLQILARTRAASLKLLRAKNYRLALDLYLRTFVWNLSDLRYRYLLGLPLMFLFPRLRQQKRTPNRIAIQSA